jgi:photosystem II stability/assembly factor-like uncharacterized protein
MKKTCLALAISLFCVLQASSQWYAQPQISGTPYLYKIHFFTAMNGLACGEFNGIYKTADGGFSWTQVTTGDTWLDVGAYYGMAFTTASIGFICGESAFYGQAVILKTTDGGITWAPQFFGNNVTALTDICFPTPSIGYAVGDNGRVIKTTNGGNTWSYLSSVTVGIYESVCFTNANDGYAVGDTIAYRTTNGGITWSSMATGGSYHYCVRFKNSQQGYLIDWNRISHTSDGGISWNVQYFNSNANFYRIQVMGDTAYAVGAGLILKTINNGGYWSPQIFDTIYTNNGLQQLFDVNFINANEGWISGYFGTVLKTTNAGGPTFFPMDDSGINSIQNITCSGPQNINVKLHDFGIDTLTNAVINCTVDGNPIPAFNWSGNILPDSSSAYFAIGNYGFSPGPHLIKAWTAMPNGVSDNRQQNDSLSFYASTSPCNPNDGGIRSFRNSYQYCSGTANVCVSVKNFGTSPLTSAVINLKVNGTPLPAYSWTGMLLPGDTSNYVAVSSYPFVQNNSYVIKAWTSMPNGFTDPQNQNDTLSINVVAKGLRGSYTIGGTAPDYQTFNLALSDLSNIGICDSVIFLVRQGTYNEKVMIPWIKQASKYNTVTFTSELNDSSSVLINYGAANYDFVVGFDSTFYVTVQKMTIQPIGNFTGGNAVLIQNHSSHVSVLNCHLIGKTGTSTGYEVVRSTYVAVQNTVCSYNTIANNLIENGNAGIYFVGKDTFNLCRGIYISNNRINNQSRFGIVIFNHDSATLTGNYLTPNVSTGSYSGIKMQDSRGQYSISKNQVYGNCEMGIEVKNCLSVLNKEGLISNNMLFSLGTSLAWVIHIQASKNIRIFYNSVKTTSASTSSAPLVCPSGNSYLTIRNNIFANYGAGRAMFNPNALSVSNNNDLYSTSANFVFWNTSSYSNLTSYRNATGQDLNSISVAPPFISNSNLHIDSMSSVMNGLAQPLFIADDVDNQQRDTQFPDIGADEYNPYIFTGNNPGCCVPQLKIFPNPSNGLFTFVLPATNDPAILEIYSFSGELVFKFFEIKDGEIHLDLSQYPSGLYYCHMILGSNSTITRLIKL